jgi:hypothetical protein
MWEINGCVDQLFTKSTRMNGVGRRSRVRQITSEHIVIVVNPGQKKPPGKPRVNGMIILDWILYK